MAATTSKMGRTHVRMGKSADVMFAIKNQSLGQSGSVQDAFRPVRYAFGEFVD